MLFSNLTDSTAFAAKAKWTFTHSADNEHLAKPLDVRQRAPDPADHAAPAHASNLSGQQGKEFRPCDSQA